jgi:hypothetical protein
MKRAASFLLPASFFLFVLLAACQLAPSPTPPTPGLATPFTATPPPASAAPSSTAPAPAATSTPETPSAETPAGAPTPDPGLGVGDVLYADPLDGSTGWGWKFEDAAAMFSVGGGQLNAVMKQANVGPRFSLRGDLNFGDQQLSATARANLCYERDEYGVMFRFVHTASNNYNGYIFKLNCGGAARVELLRDEQITVLVDWTPSAAIVAGAPAENKLLVWMAKDEFRFYVNDRYLFSLNDPTYAEGFCGFYIRDRTNGGESVSFDDLAVREVRLP